MSRYFVTGAQGCIGTWIVRNLVDRNKEVFVYDLDLEPRRISMLLSQEKLSNVHFIQGDVTDFKKLSEILQIHQILLIFLTMLLLFLKKYLLDNNIVIMIVMK